MPLPEMITSQLIDTEVYTMFMSQSWHTYKEMLMISQQMASRPLFIKRQDVSPTNLVKPRRREIRCSNGRIARKCDGHLGSAATEVPVKFQSDRKSLTPNLAALSFTSSCGKMLVHLVNRGSEVVNRESEVHTMFMSQSGHTYKNILLISQQMPSQSVHAHLKR